MKKGQHHYEWQIDPATIRTETVQFWTASGVMLTAQMSKLDAQELVRQGNAWVITGQAIEAYE